MSALGLHGGAQGLLARLEAWLQAPPSNSFGDPPGWATDADDWHRHATNYSGGQLPQQQNINSTTGWLK